MYTTNLHHDTSPICIAMFLQKYSCQGSLEHSSSTLRILSGSLELLRLLFSQSAYCFKHLTKFLAEQVAHCQPGAQKVANGVEKRVKIDCFSTILTLFRLPFRLLGPQAKRPWELIFRLFLQLWARRAQMTPVAGKSFRNFLGWCSYARSLPQKEIALKDSQDSAASDAETVTLRMQNVLFFLCSSCPSFRSASCASSPKCVKTRRVSDRLR